MIKNVPWLLYVKTVSIYSEKRDFLASNPQIDSSPNRVGINIFEGRLLLSGFASFTGFLARDLNQVVRRVDWTREDVVKVEIKTGEVFEVLFCLVMLPVGVPKGLRRGSAVTFESELPMRMRQTIDNLGTPRLGATTRFCPFF